MCLGNKSSVSLCITTSRIQESIKIDSRFEYVWRPNIPGGTQGIRDNITENVGTQLVNGAVRTTVMYKNMPLELIDYGRLGGINYALDASLVSSLFGGSDTLQPNSLRAFLLIKF